jgi:hypothetical protein
MSVSGELERTTGGWEAYVGLARELDAVRAAEAARTAGVHQAVAQMSEHADGLQERLQAQGAALTQLGRTLRLRTGKLTPAPTEPVTEPAPLLSEVAAAIDEADRTANDALDRGRYAALLPRWSSGARNFLIYGVAALGVVIAQVIAFFRSDLGQDSAAEVGSGSGPNALVVLVVIPLVGWLIGYLAASLAGRPRIAEGRVRLNPRMGLLMCFMIGPVIVGALMIHSFSSR